ncbi:MAG: hypothetical protein OTJ97_00825 [SAR202 cluster bacterium]|nr:hypothetical protein [SAR202 cluster bacterium]
MFKRSSVLGLLAVFIMLPQTDTFRLSPAKTTASEYLFSLAGWEVMNVPYKWYQLLLTALSGSDPSREERLASLDRYLQLARMVRKENNRIEGLAFRSSSTLSTGSVRERSERSTDYLDELTAEKEAARADAEGAIESELSAVLIEENLTSMFGFLFPPVDLRFDRPPTVLVVSPRDRIELTETVLLHADVSPMERDRLETELLERYDLSALVADLGGIATYPSLVNDLRELRSISRLAAHEWLHQYFTFHSLGRHYRSSSEMLAINETAADMAGRELGDILFARMGGDLSVSESRYLSVEQRNPAFTREMRETRQRTEELLDEGKIAEAEQYLKERWWFIRLRGIGLRKLNQAYFAFYGSYAASAASISPIGAQLAELRQRFPGVGGFLNVVATISDYDEYLELLERYGIDTESEETTQD